MFRVRRLMWYLFFLFLQSEIRAISVNQWGSQLGLSVLNKLSQLYCSLVWESTVLLSLCTPNRLVLLSPHMEDLSLIHSIGTSKSTI